MIYLIYLCNFYDRKNLMTCHSSFNWRKNLKFSQRKNLTGTLILHFASLDNIDFYNKTK